MSEVIVVGLASLFLWYLLAEASITAWLFGWLREHAAPLVMCPWCAGTWIVLIVLLVSGDYDLMTHLAATAVVGFLGSHSG